MEDLAPEQAPTSQEAHEVLEVALRAAHRAGATGADLDDVAQATAEKLLKRWNDPTIAGVRARSPDSWRAFIAAAARNAFIDLSRSRDRRRAREDRAVGRSRQDVGSGRPGVRRQYPAPPSNVEQYITRLELVCMIAECQLTVQQRRVVALYFVDGLDSGEIAIRLRTSRQVVNRQKRLAIEQLYQRLEAARADETPDTSPGTN